MSHEEHTKHQIDEATYNDVLNGLKKAKKIADEVFTNPRSRDIFMVYEHLLGALHCDHQEKEPWEH